MDSAFTSCVQYKDCEKRGDCSIDSRAIMANTMESVGMSIQQLQQIPMCMEKIIDAPQFISQNPYQRAAFLLSTLWEPNETVTISFMPVPRTYPGNQPDWNGKPVLPRAGDIMAKWYTKSQVNSEVLELLTPEEEEFEIQVRELEPMDAVRKIVLEKVQPVVGLKLQFVQSGGDIRIGFDNRQGAYSVLGIQCRLVPSNEATMNLGWLDVATTIHEFCHALGMIHEHQNPFGKGIDWNIPRVVAWVQSTQGPSWDLYTICTNIFMKYSVDLVNGSNYDPRSIMLYSYPPEVTKDNRGTYRNIRLSTQDKRWLSNLYPADGSPRKFPTRSSVDDANIAQPTTPGIADYLKNLQNIRILGLDPKWSIILVVVVVMVLFSLFRYLLQRNKRG
jgi:hypothetical protein